jgi:hypothetical protein
MFDLELKIWNTWNDYQSGAAFAVMGHWYLICAHVLYLGTLLHVPLVHHSVNLARICMHNILNKGAACTWHLVLKSYALVTYLSVWTATAICSRLHVYTGPFRLLPSTLVRLLRVPNIELSLHGP